MIYLRDAISNLKEFIWTIHNKKNKKIKFEYFKYV